MFNIDFKCFLLTLLFVVLAKSAATSIPLFSLPAVDYADLTVQDELAISSVANALTTVGALQITGIPHFHTARVKALQPAAACLLADPTAPSVKMGDDKFRVSTAAASTGGTPGIMSGECGKEADSLRSSVDGAVYQLLNAMDKYSGSYQNNDKRSVPEYVMKPYRRYSDIFQHGEHLEHLHAFFNEDKTSALLEAAAPTLDFHTDAGLFIAMTAGLYASDQGELLPDETNGLYLQLMSGSVVEVHANEGALIIMVGDGGTRWLAPLLGSSLRAAPHSLRIASTTGRAHSRAWFGKMYLPPSDALLPTAATEGGDQGIPFRYDQYRRMEMQHLNSASSPLPTGSGAGADAASLPSACGHKISSNMDVRGAVKSSHDHDHDHSMTGQSMASSYSHLVGNDLCGASDGTGVMCWTQCMSVAGLPCGLEAECVDTATGEVVDGNIMCPSDHENCELQCVEQNDPNSENSTDFYDDYCWGNGVTMYMNGFKSISGSHQGKTECINLFFEEWTLDNKSFFAAACIGVFFLGMFIELLVLLRRRVFNEMSSSLLRNLIMVLLHGTNVVLSYFIMLVAMTYNVELFCMAVSGLTVGFTMFNIAEPPRHTTDPCCSLGHEGAEENVSMGPMNPMYAADSTLTADQTVTYQVEGQGPMSIFNDTALLESVKAYMLEIAGVKRVHHDAADGRIFDVSFHGDANLGNQLAVHIGMHFSGLSVLYLENVAFFIRIDGMTCGSCTETVRRATAQVEGVKFCLVDLKRELCGVVMSRDSSNIQAVVDSIEDVGFDAKVCSPNKV
mmetsp:Transcript_1659/g.2921  ORF Transcript_1659/g.2921 Transcript_1659/m.2921 type:complete len:790 (+) Transcript_1659:117-2486(+)|eukprot:CAMPEP_0114432572 /NCGR_PEP_ID=MMETSP0103-20121206/11225_1 /TAXON_ID=37642 ORGANISM="Paraphysomonas imperforata, Strain PA2" /NCGR_SAMPLE_ID=MMETSP0103 /ASSEMBLY_ACC=CAM_ASM_000201 /LENGTH=789 /DNA_ID=CAMNT_0001602253 /DNA_START=69 /DNA_END=2438 /DNA_ORIENTATION=+